MCSNKLFSEAAKVKKFHQGIFAPSNPQKYRGNVNEITFRSSWEAATMYWLDMNPKILEWGSETHVIPYLNPIDEKVHRYIIDFWVRTQDEGTWLVEVKPQKECLPPRAGRGRRLSRVEAERVTYAVNQAKWLAAEQYALSEGYRFWVWDETTLRKYGIAVPT